MVKRPLLELVVHRLGIADERIARALIMAGRIYADGQRLTLPSHLVSPDSAITQAPVARFVSRGGEKLLFATEQFDLQMRGLVVADIGSSTGGFVDCALQQGAAKVYAIDVGTNQLAYSLRTDKRVVVLEQTNLKQLVPSMFSPLPDLVVCDVSFISLRHVFKATSALCPVLMALVKPQFEASREQMKGTGGLCPEHLHDQIIRQVQEHAEAFGYVLEKIAPCPVRGKSKGNIEYVSLWRGKQW